MATVTLCDLEGCENEATFHINVDNDEETYGGLEFDACTMEDAAEHWAAINKPAYLKALRADG
jgi:hypothetical protein